MLETSVDFKEISLYGKRFFLTDDQSSLDELPENIAIIRQEGLHSRKLKMSDTTVNVDKVKIGHPVLEQHRPVVGAKKLEEREILCIPGTYLDHIHFIKCFIIGDIHHLCNNWQTGEIPCLLEDCNAFPSQTLE